MDHQEDRRPLATRQHKWAHSLARSLVNMGMTPNQMSLAGICFAISGAAAYVGCIDATDPLRACLLVLAALCIQLRLLANMLDGLMAVEEGKKTATGAIYNELPDRLADVLFLAAAGYAADMPSLGWLAAVLAILTAYVRALGGSLGCKQDFCGPMAKPHRMFVLTLGSLLAACFSVTPLLALTIGIIALGSALTLWRRTYRLARLLAAGAANA